MFRLRDLAKIIPQSVILGDRDAKWEHISIDSRKINPGDLFFALKGETHDGHQFIGDGYEKGCSGVVLEKHFFQTHPSLSSQFKIPFLLVEDSLSALHLWAGYYHSLFDLSNVCITGSNGKTTTKEMIAHLLSLKYHILKSEGNYNNEIGVPLTLFNLTPEHDVLIMEMAARKSGEIKVLTNMVKPDIAIITNIGEAHIGLFQTRDHIAKEKSELISSLREDGTAILNHDDPYFNDFKNKRFPYHDIISFGFHRKSQLRAENFRQEDESGIYFDLQFQEGKQRHVFVPVLGKFNVYNTLAALATGIKLGISIDEMIQSLSVFENPGMRMEHFIIARKITLIKDYYNANPTAVKGALNTVAGMKKERPKVAVLGDMLELGNQVIEYHQEIGEYLFSLSFDMLFGFGEFGKFITEGALSQGMDRKKVYYFKKEEKEKLAVQLSKLVPDNSVVLLKGSRSMKMEQIVQNWQEEEKKTERASYV